jgi:hypothetical protein
MISWIRSLDEFRRVFLTRVSVMVEKGLILLGWKAQRTGPLRAQRTFIERTTFL